MSRYDPRVSQQDYYRSFDAGRLRASGTDKPILYTAWARRLARRFRDGRLLEIGCGEGHFLRRAADQGTRVTGIDISSAGTRTARARLGRGTLARADGMRLPCSENAFDCVVAFDVVEHVPDPAAFLHECARVLAPGGALVLTTPNLQSLGRRLKGERWFAWQDPTHIGVQARGRWKSALARAGFGIETEGTDAPWDAPYIRSLPALPQRWLCAALAQALFFFRPCYPFTCGENLVFVCERDAVPAPA